MKVFDNIKHILKRGNAAYPAVSQQNLRDALLFMANEIDKLKEPVNTSTVEKTPNEAWGIGSKTNGGFGMHHGPFDKLTDCFSIIGEEGWYIIHFKNGNESIIKFLWDKDSFTWRPYTG